VSTGWMIGVLVEGEGRASAPSRLFFAVAQPDRARAEWAAADRAMLAGTISASPHGGMEPVEAIAELTAHKMDQLGLAAGQVRALGDRWPRRWLAVRVAPRSEDQD